MQFWTKEEITEKFLALHKKTWTCLGQVWAILLLSKLEGMAGYAGQLLTPKLIWKLKKNIYI